MLATHGHDISSAFEKRAVERAAKLARRRLQRDIHDVAGQYLVGAVFMLAALEERVKDRELHASLVEVRVMIDHFGEELKAVVAGHSTALSEGQGLIGALQRLIADWEHNIGIPVTFRQEISPPLDLDDTTGEVAYRIVQEALTNVAKHAKSARTVGVRLHTTPRALVLTVEDDGPGLHRALPLRAGNAYGHNGIAGMRERLRELGGNLIIRSIAGEGTRLTATIPIGRADQ